MTNNKLTRPEAFSKDVDFWVDTDEESGCEGVFGTETGFCYGLCLDTNSAERYAVELRAIKAGSKGI